MLHLATGVLVLVDTKYGSTQNLVRSTATPGCSVTPPTRATTNTRSLYLALGGYKIATAKSPAVLCPPTRLLMPVRVLGTLELGPFRHISTG